MLKGERGFTLVELMVVVGILTVLATMSVPSFISWRENAKYKEAAQLVFSKMKEAKDRAINVNQRTRITFNMTTKKIVINVMDPGSTLGDEINSVDFPSGVDIKGWSTVSGCTVTVGTMTTFNTDGSANVKEFCILNGTERKYKVGVKNATTGRIVLERWQDGAWK